MKCWGEDDDESLAVEIEAATPRAAAEEFVQDDETFVDCYDDHYSDVFVRDASGELWKVSVLIETEVSYTAGSAEKVDEPGKKGIPDTLTLPLPFVVEQAK
jgi:hypothetical protein